MREKKSNRPERPTLMIELERGLEIIALLLRPAQLVLIFNLSKIRKLALRFRSVSIDHPLGFWRIESGKM